MGAIHATPRVPGEFIARQRLTTRFDTDAPLVVVRGPAGSGKTVAVAQWARQAGDGVWVTVDGENSTRLTFWRAIIEQLVDAGLLAASSTLATSIQSLDTITDLGRFLVRELRGLGRCTIVIDSYDRIGDDQINEDVVALVTAAVELRIVVVTRTSGGLHAQRVRVELAPTVIEPRELLFTYDEVLAVVQRAGIPDASSAAAALKSAVDGLPVAVRAIVMLMTQGEPIALDDAVRRGVSDVVHQLQRDGTSSPTIDVDFALRCSVARALTVELARLLSGRDDAQVALDRAESLGLGLWSESGGATHFSFSPVIRQGLCDELERKYPDEVHELHRIAAQWAFDNERWAAAFRHAVAGRDLALASRIIIQDWASFSSVHSDLTLTLLEPLSYDTLRHYTVLAMALALNYYMANIRPQASGKLLTFVVASSAQWVRRTTGAEQIVMLAVHATSLRLTGRFLQAAAPSARLLETVAAAPRAERQRLRRILPMILAQMGINFFYSGQTARALEVFDEAIELSRHTYRTGWFHALALAAGTHAVSGSMRQAQELLRLGQREQWPEGWRDSYVGSFYHVALAYAALEAGDVAGAQKQMDVVAPGPVRIEHWPIFLQVQALIDLGSGHALAGAARIKAALVPGVSPVASETSLAGLVMTRGLLLIAAGRLDEAEQVIAPFPSAYGVVGQFRARLWLMRGEPTEALSVIDAVVDDAGSPRVQAALAVLRTVAHLRLGDETRAVEWLYESLRIMRGDETRIPFTLQPAVDRAAFVGLARRIGMRKNEEHLIDELAELPGLWPEPQGALDLTDRERVVLRQLALSPTTADIAEALFVSVNTVKTQLRSVYRKLQVTSRDEAITVAEEHGLLHGAPLVE